MSGNITITPRRVLNNETISLSKLNDLGNPTAQIDEAAVTPRELADDAFTGDKFADDSIPVAKLAKGTANQQFRTNAAGTGVEWYTPATPTAYATRANSTGNQSVATDGNRYKLLLPQRAIGSADQYDTALSRFTAPVHGAYRVSFGAQIDNIDAGPADLQMTAFMFRGGNTVAIDLGDVLNVKNASEFRWYLRFSGLMEIAAGEVVEVGVECLDSGGTGHVNFANMYLCLELVQAL